MTAPALLPPAAHGRVRAGRWLTGRRRPALVGGIYVVAWRLGLVIAPSAPAIDASALAVHRFYLGHTAAAVVQSLLVHGVAGLALLLLAVDLRRVLRSRAGRSLTTAATGAGVIAGVVSLIQVVCMVVLAAGIATATPERTLRLVQVIDTADAAKLLAWWLCMVGAVLAPLLPISGATFVLDQPGLYGALYISLPLLLVWVAGAGVAIGRSTGAQS
jgi:hypothetical protein